MSVKSFTPSHIHISSHKRYLKRKYNASQWGLMLFWTPLAFIVLTVSQKRKMHTGLERRFWVNYPINLGLIWILTLGGNGGKF